MKKKDKTKDDPDKIINELNHTLGMLNVKEIKPIDFSLITEIVQKKIQENNKILKENNKILKINNDRIRQNMHTGLKLNKDIMRLSGFKIEMTWLIGLTILIIIAFSIEFKGDRYLSSITNVPILFIRLISVMFLFIWSVELSDTLRGIVNLKYRIVEDKYGVSVKYLTFWWVLIPFWKVMKEKQFSYELKNVFGTKIGRCIEVDFIYKNKEEAIAAIDQHKVRIKKNRNDWLKSNKEESKKVSYI